jgi:general secretion pathway protein F
MGMRPKAMRRWSPPRSPRPGAKGLNVDLKLPARIPALERAMATRQLATLVNAGVPLVEALSALVEQTEHRALKAVFARVRERVNEGSTLADALVSTGRFDNLYVSMVRAGEASGALDAVLARIADYSEDSVRLNNRVLSILTYPLFMLGFAGVVVGVMSTVVLPQITELLIAQNLALPWYTRAVIGFSEALRGYWWLLILMIVGAAFGYRAFARTKRGRSTLDRMWLRVPVVGRIIRLLAIARFTRTLGSLLASSVNIVQALNIARHVANNTVFEAASDMARDAILEGAALAKPMRASGQFPAAGHDHGRGRRALGHPREHAHQGRRHLRGAGRDERHAPDLAARARAHPRHGRHRRRHHPLRADAHDAAHAEHRSITRPRAQRGPLEST